MRRTGTSVSLTCVKFYEPAQKISQVFFDLRLFYSPLALKGE